MKKLKALFYKHHRIFGIILFIPLFLTAITGVLAIIFDEVFDNRALAKLMIEIHTMEILGIEDIYCIIVGIGMIWLLVTGLVLSGIFPFKPKKTN
ncbi:MAG: hypothetical protein PHC34_00905 [Candidatus Gastranaerophilales bacterium]|nr:hypothetical protein [Candidatus Gastranaerophilales bacterium]